MRTEILFLRKLAVWTAVILLPLALLAAVGVLVRAPHLEGRRIARGFLEQVGTFLPFASYAAALRTAMGRGTGRWVAPAGAAAALLTHLLLGAADALATHTPPPTAAAWDLHNRPAHAAFGFLLTGIGAVVGAWLAGRGSRGPAWEAWLLALVLLVVLLAGQLASWSLVVRHGVPAGPAVWLVHLSVPAILLAAWGFPSLVGQPRPAA